MTADKCGSKAQSRNLELEKFFQLTKTRSTLRYACAITIFNMIILYKSFTFDFWLAFNMYPSLSKYVCIKIFLSCHVWWLHCFCDEWEGWALLNRFNHTSEVTAVTQNDRPKLVRNLCVINVFGGVFYVVTLLLDFSVGVGVLSESDLFLFLFLFIYFCKHKDI